MCAIALTATLSGACSATADADTQKPNIVLILADDLGYGDLGCYGQKEIKTPNLDRMAAEGLRFTQAYAGATVCAPSRCVLMTGLHVGHARIRGNREAFKPGAGLEASDITVAEVLKDAGYTTALIGKWGLGETSKNTDGLPWDQGFDFFYGYLKHGHAHNYYPEFLWRNQTPEKLPNVVAKNPRFKGNVSEKKTQYSHDLFADESLKFVREHKDTPFFLYLAFTIPHANNEAGERGMEVPDYGDYADRDWPAPEKGKAAMISRMDSDIGSLLALLQELKIDDQTLVIFTSDNGPPKNEGGRLPEFNDSNGPLRGHKGEVTEGGIRVPFIARWPGRIAEGVTIDSAVTGADLMPTLAAIASATAPSGIDGLDVSPTLFGKNQPQLSGRFLYWEWGKVDVGAQAARWNNWKTIRDPKTGKIGLYDLATDIGETRDVAAEHPDIVAKFETYYWTARTDSQLWPMNALSKNEKNARRNNSAADGR
jgi:arylsulfatase A-like enzyme